MSVKNLVALIYLMMAALHPSAPHVGQAATVANAVAYVVAQDPLPAGWAADEAAAVLVVMAWKESRFGSHMVGPATCKSGDCHAYGIWQAEHRPDLAKDAVAAARYEYDLLRKGVNMCPEHPLAMAIGGCYVAGTRRPNKTAQSISDARAYEAYRVLYTAESQEF